MTKCISSREIDELGEGIVCAYLKNSGMRGSPKCVDIEGVACSIGLQVTYEKFAENDSDMIGFLADGLTSLMVMRMGGAVPVCFPSGTIVVDTVLRRDNESGRRRFTIAHEIAHYLIGRHNPSARYQRTFDPERSYTLKELQEEFDLAELQADRLAASILMPRFIVETALKNFNGGKIICIFGDNILSPEDRITVNRMAARIGVSYTALLIRLRHLRLLDYHPVAEYVESEFLEK